MEKSKFPKNSKNPSENINSHFCNKIYDHCIISDQCADGWMDGTMDGRTDRMTDGQTEIDT